MRPDLTLDEILEQCLAQDLSLDDIAEYLLHEEREDWKRELIEVQTATTRRVGSGGIIRTKIRGRKDPRRRIAARRGAMKGRAARARAARNPRSKMQRKRTMATRNRMGIRPLGNKVRRPKRQSRPKLRRPRAGSRPRTARRSFRRR